MSDIPAELLAELRAIRDEAREGRARGHARIDQIEAETSQLRDGQARIIARLDEINGSVARHETRLEEHAAAIGALVLAKRTVELLFASRKRAVATITAVATVIGVPVSVHAVSAAVELLG